LSDRAARCSPRICDGKFDNVQLEEWIGGMEKIFVLVQAPEEEKVNM